MVEAPFTVQVTLRCLDCDRALFAVRSQKPLDSSATFRDIGSAMVAHATWAWSTDHQCRLDVEAADGSQVWQPAT